MQSLEVSLKRDDSPALLARRIRYDYGFFEYVPQARAPRQYAEWARQSRMEQSFAVNAGHAWQTSIDENKAAFAAHPEYRALTSGKREGEQLCISNPVVRKLAVDGALDSSKSIRGPT